MQVKVCLDEVDSRILIPPAQPCNSSLPVQPEKDGVHAGKSSDHREDKQTNVCGEQGT